MSSLGNGWLNVKAIDKKRLKETKGGSLGFSFQFAINDKVDQFGNNVSVWMAQTEEERKAKEPRIYLGNGKLHWTDGTLTVVTKDTPEGKTIKASVAEPEAVAEETVDDNVLPF